MKTIRANIFGCLGGVGLLIFCGLLTGVAAGSSDALWIACVVGVVTALLGIWAARERRNIQREKDQAYTLEVARAMSHSVNVTVGQPAQAPVEDAARAQLKIARDLITAKQYPQARALLKTINHPKASEWLAKLDGMGV